MPCIAMVERALPKPARVMVTYFNRKTNNSVTVYIFFILAFHFQYNPKSASIFFFIRFSKTELYFHSTFKTIIFNIHFEEKVCNTN